MGKPWKIEKQRHIMETAYRLFSEKGIAPVTIVEIAKASGIGKATLFRYYPSKLDLVIAIATWKWEEYIDLRVFLLPPEEKANITGAEWLHFFLDSFLDLYQNHSDILRFNYDFNSFLRYEAGSEEQILPFTSMVDKLGETSHELYERGMKDGSLNTDISEQSMFSSIFHIMLAAVTRYAVGLVYMYEGSDPASELVMLEELLLSRFVSQKSTLSRKENEKTFSRNA